jgi:hypothetical protein
VQAIFRHLGLDWRYLGDLVPVGLRVFAGKGLATLPAGGRLERDRLLDPLRRHQGALQTSVARLSAPLTTGRLLRRPAFDVGWVAGGRTGGVGGVLVKPLSQFIDLVLEGL